MAEQEAAVAMYQAAVFVLNRRIIVHEAQTAMWGHDENGECCLRARLTPLPDEAAAAPEVSP